MIIGVSGRKRAGKDTISNHLVKTYAFTRVSFADPVKALAYRINPIIEFNKSYHDLQYVVDLLGWEEAKAVPGVRRTLQNIGNEAREVLGKMVWIDQALHKASSYTVISDTRYLNEASAIHANGGRVLKVVRPGGDNSDAHPSETEVDKIRGDFTLINEGSVEDLLAKVDRVMKTWGLGSTV